MISRSCLRSSVEAGGTHFPAGYLAADIHADTEVVDHRGKYGDRSPLGEWETSHCGGMGRSQNVKVYCASTPASNPVRVLPSADSGMKVNLLVNPAIASLWWVLEKRTRCASRAAELRKAGG
jgi:hypothetical protein